MLLTVDNVIKLGDLGVAKVMQHYNMAHTRAGTQNNMSPEMRDQEE